MNNNQNRNNNSNYNRTPNKSTRNTAARRRKTRRGTPLLVTFGFRFLMFLIFFALISAVCFAVFSFTVTRLKTPPDILYTVNTIETVKNEEKIVSTPLSLPNDTGFAHRQHYFPINDIMEKMDFILAGDKKEISFIRTKSDEYVKFVMNSSITYINDEEYRLSGPAFSDDENQIYVPLDFLQNAFENLTFTFDEKNNNKITVDVGNIEDSCFKIRKIKKLEVPEEAEAPYFSSDPINFKTDLKEYEKYFNPPADSINEYLVLINQTNPLDPQYVPPDLTDLADTRKDGRAIQQTRLYPAMALEAFLIEARANGYANVTVTSAYRNYELQAKYFNDEVAVQRPAHGDNAEAVAAKSVAYPGQSEHQSGLGLDMHNLAAAGVNFGDTPEGKWLAENAHYFGFILRYPKDKTEITGIKYEPWHFRYVGRYHATKMYSAGLCFEEYWEQYLKK
jgi:LAS superfamily LD-carboxypeptidase LdcB